MTSEEEILKLKNKHIHIDSNAEFIDLNFPKKQYVQINVLYETSLLVYLPSDP